MQIATPQSAPKPTSALDVTRREPSDPAAPASPAAAGPSDASEAFDSARPLPKAFRDKHGHLQINPYLDATGHSYHVQMSPNAPGVPLRSLKCPVPNLPLRNMVRDYLRGDAQWRRNGESPITYAMPAKAVMMVTLDGKAVGAGSAFDVEDIRSIYQHERTPRDPLTRTPLPHQVRIIPNLAVHAVRLETKDSDGTSPGTPTPAEHTTIDIHPPTPVASSSEIYDRIALTGRIGCLVLATTVSGALIGVSIGSMVARNYTDLMGWLHGGTILGAFFGIGGICAAMDGDND